MSIIQPSYPADSVSVTATGLASLASSATLVAGYALAVVSNRTNKDDTHQWSVAVKMGTSPTANTQAQLWIIKARSFISATVAYPACFTGSYTGSAGAFTANSAGALQSVGKLAWVGNVDSTTTGGIFEGTGIDIAALFGGNMPMDYFPFFVHNNVAAWDSTGGSFVVTYDRIQYTNT